ncbi:hypothetical protein HW509_10685 [Asaia spathodeae]|uniref:hypothetical protein n=1 Tax=Asaia spathodeae TaxID=657016 RepID=UPI002FC329D4
MKNPAKPGVSSTNGTRGVVLSGMSETTKRTLGADMIDLSVPWAKRIDRTHLAARPVDQQALRASRLGAEGGAGDFAPTRSGNVGSASEAQTSREIGKAYSEWQWAALKWAFVPLHVVFLAILVSDLGAALGLLVWGFSFATGALIAKFWVIPFFEARRMATLRASGGEGV